MYETPTSWSCGRHENLKEPKFAYVAFTETTDHTNSTKAKIFDNALATIVGKSCRDVVIKEGYTDRFQVPKPLYDVIGETYFMHVPYTRVTTLGSSLLAVNKISKQDPTPLPHTYYSTITDSNRPCQRHQTTQVSRLGKQ